VSASSALRRFTDATEALQFQLPSSYRAVADLSLLLNLLLGAALTEELSNTVPSLLWRIKLYSY